MTRRTMGAMIGLLLVAAVGVTAYHLHHARPPSLLQLPETDTEHGSAAVTWIDGHVIPLHSVLPGPSDSDLTRFGSALDSVLVVGLGEASHGSSPLFQIKARLIRYLVRDQGFRVLAMEASAPAAEMVDDYLLHGHGTLENAIRGLGFWTWNTQEVAATIQWLRTYDATQPPDRQVKFVGFDMQGLEPAYDSLAAVIRGVAPTLAVALDSVVVAQRSLLHIAPDSVAMARSLAMAQSLVGRLVADSAVLREKLGPARTSRTLWYAQLVDQLASVMADLSKRDSLMAANVLRIARLNPTDRIILWSHDMHITRSGRAVRGGAMGNYLAHALGVRYYALALTFDDGSILARDMAHGNALTALSLGRAREGSVESVLARVPYRSFILDLRSAPDTGAVAAWLATPRLLRSFGASFSSRDDRRGGFLEITHLRQDYDGIGFVRRSTASQPLEGPGR